MIEWNTRYFFDSPKVERMIGKVRARGMMRVGGKIRETARRMIKVVTPTEKMLERLKSTDIRKRNRALATIQKRRNRVSKPGEPPLAHTKDPVRTIRNIQYAFDARKGSVIAGPVRLRSRRTKNNVPATLERGGSVEVQERLIEFIDKRATRKKDSGGRYRKRNAVTKKIWVPGSSKDPKKSRRRTVRLKPRPFMGPTQDKLVAGGKLAWFFKQGGTL